MLTTTMLALSLAVAAEPPEPQPFRRDPHWEDVYGRADRTARLGLNVSLAGPPLVLAGAVGLVLGWGSGDPFLGAAGALGVLGGTGMLVVGPPLLLGGSMRARYALEQQGLHVPGNYGYAGWVSYGSALVIPPMWFGAVGFGAAQRSANRRALRALGYTVQRPVDVEIAPWVSPDHAGAALRFAL